MNCCLKFLYNIFLLVNQGIFVMLATHLEYFVYLLCICLQALAINEFVGTNFTQCVDPDSLQDNNQAIPPSLHCTEFYTENNMSWLVCVTIMLCDFQIQKFFCNFFLSLYQKYSFCQLTFLFFYLKQHVLVSLNKFDLKYCHVLVL